MSVVLGKDGLPKRKVGRPSKADLAERRALEAARHNIRLEIPEAFAPLYERDKWRIKCFWGGRGAAKSWQFADALLIQGYQKQQRFLCTRELQKSIKDSVHQLLRDRIQALNIGAEYQVTDAEITGFNRTQFIFKGLKHNTEEVKSTEGVDICWVEEGQKTTAASWRILTPTIRKPGSEIWVSMNVDNAADHLYKELILAPGPDTYSKKVSWRDNPWFPDVLKREMEALKARDYDEYLHVWEGELKAFADGAYYKKELLAMRSEGRITKVPHDPLLKTYTVWDLGIGDATAIGFWQMHRQEMRLIDCYEMSGEGLPHYAKVLQEKPYVYGGHFAPHDIAVRELGTGKSRLEQAAALGINFQTVANLPVDDGIAALRALLPLMWVDEDKGARFLECLAHYHKEWDDDRQDFRLRPAHNWSSHMADMGRYAAIGLKEAVPVKPYVPPPAVAMGWMS